MKRIILDTDVVSFLFRGDARAKKYQPHLAGREAVISFMTLAELRLWALVRRWGDGRRRQLERHLRRFAVHPYDPALCTLWAEVTHLARIKGRALQTADAWIAATAKLHELPLVTHNASDCQGVDGLHVITEPD
jgi:predicted nucleic acid-binding protein